jgi:transposase
VEDTLLAVDLAKDVFEVAVSRRPGRVDASRRLRRDGFLEFFGQQPPATVVMEACGSAHYWARCLRQLGHRVRLLPASQVRPYRRGNKTDKADAKALLEAFRNQDIREVPVKTVAQQAVGVVHRLRSTWLEARTARLNAVRGLLREHGLFIPPGAERVVPQVRVWIADDGVELAAPVRVLLASACEEILDLERRIAEAGRQLEAIAENAPRVRLWTTIPGIGLLCSTALFAFVGDPARFRSARHFASYLGLTPRERSSGNRRRLGRISKRGDAYVRHLLIHGARALLGAARRARRPDRLRTWALDLAARTHFNKATCALANKIARIAWAVSRQQREYVAA